LVAAVLVTVQDWGVLAALDSREVIGLSALAVLGVLSEAVAIRLRFGSSSTQSSLTFIPVLATVLLFGPAPGVALAGVIIFVSQFVLHQKPKIRAFFNVAQWIAASAFSGLGFEVTRRLVGLSVPTEYPVTMSDGWWLIPFGVFVVILFSSNYVAVAGAISLDTGKSFTTVLNQILGAAGANLVYGILISPIAFVVAVLYQQFAFRPLGLLIALLPLIFVRMSYLTNIRLQEANKDLLKALIKAIEIRDPYTSGHSLRVSALAGRIAVQMGVSQRKVEEIETAALLHDIGKIESAYTEILRKPASLSAEERTVIESHVTKGVELLESISSLSPQVIAAVRHHHEREDGRGYPDGLTSEEIPLGAKIIKVCDAIDAMLSDRPYRTALSLPQVKEQLITYAGSQFDVEIVSTVIKSDVLQQHRDEVRASREWKNSTILAEDSFAQEGKPEDLRASVRTVLASLGSRKN
jgi:putative nucleotidyltransferase with HDIG domain